MKKIFLIVMGNLAAVVLFQNVEAQFYLGAKGGISLPNLSSGSENNPVSSGYKSRLGAAAALFLEYRTGSVISFQTQLELSGQGGKKNGWQAMPVTPEMSGLFPDGEKPKYVYANYKSVAQLNYLILPVLCKANFTFGRTANLVVGAGPFISYLFDAKNITSGQSGLFLDNKGDQPLPGTSQSFDRTDNIIHDIYRLNAGVEGTLGVSVCTGVGIFLLEGGSNYGFSNIQKNAINGRNHTGAASIMIGYKLPLAKNQDLPEKRCR